MSETIDHAVFDESQIILHRGIAGELRRRQSERALFPEELCYLWLAELTLARLEGIDHNEAAQAV